MSIGFKLNQIWGVEYIPFAYWTSALKVAMQFAEFVGAGRPGPCSRSATRAVWNAKIK
jgi:hypothetical protein